MKNVLLVALLSAMAIAKDCKYFIHPSYGAYPLGINRCSYFVEGDTRTSFLISCINSTHAKVTIYDKSYQCTDTHTEMIFGPNDAATFDCSPTKMECGKLYGSKTPCTCTAQNGDCENAYVVSLVDEQCVTTTGIDVYDSLMYEITCGSISKAQASIYYYKSTDCSGSYEANVEKAGCAAAHNAKEGNNTYPVQERDIIICPGNMATLSLSLLVALIAAVFAL